MIDLTPGIHEFGPEEFLELVQQYDQFSITVGRESFIQIRVPSKWVKLEPGTFGASCLTCRNKRKRDGHLFEIYGSKFIFDVGFNADHPVGKLKTDTCGDEFVVSMWKMDDKEE